MTEFEQIRELTELVVAATIAVYWLTVLIGAIVFGTALGRYRKYHRLRFARELARLKNEWCD